MSYVDKMVILPYERYESLTENVSKTFESVSTQTENKLELDPDFTSDDKFNQCKLSSNQVGKGANEEDIVHLSLPNIKSKQEKKRPPPGVPEKKRKWLKF